ncbi:MAG: hypothetical protein LWW87_07270 [Geobacteraceae bacterium]|nr:hypothetical protein [Geobacteraceae bacterium]
MHTQFFIENQTLHLDEFTTDLEAFRWNAPNDVPVFFVFAGNDVHIITLDEQEKPFEEVCSNNQIKPVRLITDEEAEQYTFLHETASIFGTA